MHAVLLRVSLCFLLGSLIALPASADESDSTPVDQSVADWAKERLTPLRGAAAEDAKAAFASSTPAPSRTQPLPPEPLPSEPLTPFAGAQNARDNAVGSRYATSQPTPPPAQQLRVFQQPAASQPNPLRSGTSPKAEPTEPPTPSRAIESSAARRAFEPAPTVPPDNKPLRLSMETASEPPVTTMQIAPAGAQTPAPEPRAFEPPAPRVASLQRPSSGWPNPRDENRSNTDRQPKGSGQPGPSETHGPQRAGLVVEKRGPEEARVGQTCRFVVTVRNTGATPAHGVVLSDETPAGATLVRTEPLAEQNGTDLRWELGTLSPGEEQTVEMLVTPTREGPLGSVARVSFDAHASAVTRATRPQLTLRAASEPQVRIGDEHRVAIELHNPGTGVATGVMLSNDLPPQVSHPAGPALEFEVGRLAPGETRRLELMLTAEQAGRVASGIVATADGDLRVEEPLEFEVIAPSLAVSIDGPSKRYLERPANYRVSVANPGTAEARDVRLVTHLPRGLEFVSANNLGEYDAQTHAVYWSLAELPEGQRGEVEVVALPVSAGDHTLRVESEARDGLRVEEVQRVLVEGVASLAFDVRDRQDPIEIGDQAEYDIRVTNEGTKSASGVRVTVEAPSGMRFANARGETAARMASDRVEFAPMKRLAPGAEARFRVTLTGESPGDHRVSVLVASDDAPQPIRREESTRVFGNE